MTADELRELDARVHREVLRRTVRVKVVSGRTYYLTDEVGLLGLNSVPKYSDDIKAAWRVVEEMVARGAVFIVKGDGLRTGNNPKWTVLAGNQGRTDAATAPLAICLAALKAVEAKS